MPTNGVLENIENKIFLLKITTCTQGNLCVIVRSGMDVLRKFSAKSRKERGYMSDKKKVDTGVVYAGLYGKKEPVVVCQGIRRHVAPKRKSTRKRIADFLRKLAIMVEGQ